jgi:hypothetical protein
VVDVEGGAILVVAEVKKTGVEEAVEDSVPENKIKTNL